MPHKAEMHPAEPAVLATQYGSMHQSVSQLVLRAKQLEIEALRHLEARVQLAGIVGQLIDALQRERGASSVYLASEGARFGAEREAACAVSQPLEALLRAQVEAQMAPEQGASARLLSLMAWALLDLEALAALRYQIERRAFSASDAVGAYSRLIAGLLELVFYMADAAPYPEVSRLLVAFVHLVQGKETAGQERAVGAQLFASGLCRDEQQQRLVHLIDAQERSLRLFEEFAEPELRQRWQQLQLSPNTAMLERLRRSLCMARDGAALEPPLSETWFEVASERIGQLWQLQQALLDCLHQACESQIQRAQSDLQDSAGLLRQLRDNPPPRAHEADRFFQPSGLAQAAAPVASPGAADPGSAASLAGLLQAQSERLARMEVELDAARRALHERKIIERAKGALMARLGLTEEAAFRALQKASMDHNRRLLDVAEATLSLPDMVAPAQRGAQPK